MFKKVLIATLAVVFGLAVIKGTWIGSHLRLKFTKGCSWVHNQVPPEQEIARLRMELDNLARDDDKHFDKVARMAVEVKNREADLGRLRVNLNREEETIRELRGKLAEGIEFVDFNGNRYTRTDLRVKALAFQSAEENFKSKEANLAAKKRHLALERGKLANLQKTRNEMATDLQRLETALAEERQSQAASESTIDDGDYRRLRKDMEAVRTRLEILKKKRELRGEFQPIGASTKPTEQDTQADKYLDIRFGDKKEVVSDKK
jgi:septal ring factor EnvC (AmiA/AmiB activator)